MRPTTLTIALLAAAIATVLHLWPQGLTGWAGVAVVPDSSMEPTYQSGDVLLLWRQPVYEPGDVVAVETRGTQVVARVVGGHPLTGYALRRDDESMPLPARVQGPAIVGRAAIELPAVVGAPARVVSAVPSSLLAALMAAVVMLWTPERLRHRWRRRRGSEPAARPHGESPCPTADDRLAGSAEAAGADSRRPVRSSFTRWRDRSVGSPGGEPPPGLPGEPVVEVASMEMLVALARRHQRDIELRRGPDGVERAVFRVDGTDYVHAPSRSVGRPGRTIRSTARPEAEDVEVEPRYVRVATIRALAAIAERENSAVRLGRAPDGSSRPSVHVGATIYVHDGPATSPDALATGESPRDDVATPRPSSDAVGGPHAPHELAGAATTLGTVRQRPYVVRDGDGEETIVLP